MKKTLGEILILGELAGLNAWVAEADLDDMTREWLKEKFHSIALGLEDIDTNMRPRVSCAPTHWNNK